MDRQMRPPDYAGLRFGRALVQRPTFDPNRRVVAVTGYLELRGNVQGVQFKPGDTYTTPLLLGVHGHGLTPASWGFHRSLRRSPASRSSPWPDCNSATSSPFRW